MTTERGSLAIPLIPSVVGAIDRIAQGLTAMGVDAYRAGRPNRSVVVHSALVRWVHDRDAGSDTTTSEDLNRWATLYADEGGTTNKVAMTMVYLTPERSEAIQKLAEDLKAFQYPGRYLGEARVSRRFVVCAALYRAAALSA